MSARDDALWMEKCNALVNYVRVNGKMPTVKENQVLYSWYHNQRRLYKEGELRKEREMYLRKVLPTLLDDVMNLPETVTSLHGEIPLTSVLKGRKLIETYREKGILSVEGYLTDMFKNKDISSLSNLDWYMLYCKYPNVYREGFYSYFVLILDLCGIKTSDGIKNLLSSELQSFGRGKTKGFLLGMSVCNVAKLVELLPRREKSAIAKRYGIGRSIFYNLDAEKCAKALKVDLENALPTSKVSQVLKGAHEMMLKSSGHNSFHDVIIGSLDANGNFQTESQKGYLTRLKQLSVLSVGDCFGHVVRDSSCALRLTESGKGTVKYINFVEMFTNGGLGEAVAGALQNNCKYKNCAELYNCSRKVSSSLGHSKTRNLEAFLTRRVGSFYRDILSFSESKEVIRFSSEELLEIISDIFEMMLIQLSLYVEEGDSSKGELCVS